MHQGENKSEKAIFALPNPVYEHYGILSNMNILVPLPVIELAEACLLSLPAVDCEFFVGLIFRGIVARERGVSIPLCVFTVNCSCLMADFLRPARLRSLVRTGEDFTDLDLFNASISAPFT